VDSTMACRVAALFSSRREGGLASPGEGLRDGREEVEVDTQLHYVQVCTVRN